jgi:hypothetical protein
MLSVVHDGSALNFRACVKRLCALLEAKTFASAKQPALVLGTPVTNNAVTVEI